jgi:hypothetical protein
MGKLEIKFKLTGLEFEIKGESEDVIAKAAAMQQQVQGMFGAIGAVTNGASAATSPPAQNGASTKLIETTAAPVQNGNRGKRAPRRNTGGRGSVEPVSFRHEASKYGNPVQSWGNTEKCIWLLHVLKEMVVANEISGPHLAATYNHHFKATGTVRPSHATRELGRAKVKNPALVGEDKRQDPSLWYLTDEGEKYARELIASVLNPP